MIKFRKNVLVPFPGFLYLYRFIMIIKNFTTSSRPLPGVLISLRSLKCFITHSNFPFSSPSRGSYISTLSSQSLELYTHISAFAAQM